MLQLRNGTRCCVQWLIRRQPGLIRAWKTPYIFTSCCIRLIKNS
jgi:hypothetical protein